jgi:hypothetical protein
MTFKVFGLYLTFNSRNGVGLDLESCSSRPVWVESLNCFALLNGVVVLLPFLIITYGQINIPTKGDFIL